MAQRGFLVPNRYVPEIPDDVDMNVSSIFWGFSLGVAFFAAVQAGSQSIQTWKRVHRITPYIAMIWAEWIVSVIIGALVWCFQRQYVGPSYFLSLIQLLMQIIINRIALLMPVPGAARRLKWAVFLVLLVVNISVLTIWIPARLQISETWIHINDIWDRCEKVIFCLVDLSLNLRFVYLVKTELVNNGLDKYRPLCNFNLVMVVFSISLDVALIGLMSLPSTLTYLQFHPVAYLLKLTIEMKMAVLIGKIARARVTVNVGPAGLVDVEKAAMSMRTQQKIGHSSKSPEETVETQHIEEIEQ